jgi:hypothetical protein
VEVSPRLGLPTHCYESWTLARPIRTIEQRLPKEVLLGGQPGGQSLGFEGWRLGLSCDLRQLCYA